MPTTTSAARFSTVASFHLQVGDRSYSVAQVAPNFLILKNTTDHPLGPATLTIRVDGETIIRHLELLGPPDPATGELPIRRLDQVE